MYARQLAEHYGGPRRISGEREPTLPRRKTDTGLKPNELYDDREHSFLDGKRIELPTEECFLAEIRVNRRPPRNQGEYP